MNSDSVIVDLGWKGARFTLEAVDFRIKSYEKMLKNDNLSEDEISDIQNDMMLLKNIYMVISEALEKYFLDL